MRRWQFLLELLLHYTPIADSLHLCFPLGRSRRLPLAACRCFLPWPRFAEDRIILGNVSWQFRPSSFVLGHFHPNPTLVSHPYPHLSACPISHSFWCSVSCDDPDSTVQESCLHKCGQDVSCGHLMRRWQFLLELLLHYTLIADSLHLCFPLGRSRRLPLAACHCFLSWPRFAEDRIILGNVSWQFRPSSFVLGHFFLLGMGFGLDMKWAGVAKFFSPTIIIQYILFIGG